VPQGLTFPGACKCPGTIKCPIGMAGPCGIKKCRDLNLL